ncbi:MAG: alanine racemase [Chloroflexota bacterium]
MSVFDRYTTYATVDLDAIEHNVRALVAHTTAREIFAVVKSNAYGHGAVQVAETALNSGATRLAVGRVDEAWQLRSGGIHAPILVMCYTVPAEAETIVEQNLMATVISLESAEALSRRAVALGRTVGVHVKVDTGMGRFGLLPESEVLPYLAALEKLPNLEIEGIFTHFATADSHDKSYAHQQFALFQEILKMVEEAGHSIPVRHAANSAATLDLPETHLDAVRPGIALYGMYPSEEVSREVPLRPALTLKSHVGRVRTLPAGSSVSYGRTFIAKGPTTVANIPVGYGDGYHRALSNKGAVLIGGQKAPIVGRVCMDQFVVDVSHIPGVVEGDEVVLIGSQGDERITPEEVAALAGTINYEVTTGLLQRIPRLFLRGGEVVDELRLCTCG